MHLLRECVLKIAMKRTAFQSKASEQAELEGADTWSDFIALFEVKRGSWEKKRKCGGVTEEAKEKQRKNIKHSKDI